MHFVLLTTGHGRALSVQHLRHGLHPTPGTDFVDLLVLDARHMSPATLSAATRNVEEIRARHGLRHGVLLCSQPTLSLIVASIRCGLRDIITQHIGAAHLRQLLRAAIPSLGRREYREMAALLRTFSGISSGDKNSALVGRRAEELDRRAAALTEQEKALALEKDRLARAEQDIRERTRRLDRQIARLQNDADIAPGHTNAPFPVAGGTASPLPDHVAMSRRLEQRAMELDVREKLLDEVQKLLLSTPEGKMMSQQLQLATPPPTRVRGLAGAAA